MDWKKKVKKAKTGITEEEEVFSILQFWKKCCLS